MLPLVRLCVAAIHVTRDVVPNGTHDPVSLFPRRYVGKTVPVTAYKDGRYRLEPNTEFYEGG